MPQTTQISHIFMWGMEVNTARGEGRLQGGGLMDRLLSRVVGDELLDVANFEPSVTGIAERTAERRSSATDPLQTLSRVR